MWNATPSDDYLDPGEARRRRALEMDEAPFPLMEEDPQDLEPQGATAISPAEVPTIKLSPAQEKYKAALGQVPSAPEKISKWRRLAAAVAGGFAGAADPRSGAQVAQGIIDAPFERTLNNWERSTKATGLEADIEEKAMAEDVARRRASAYERSASARERAASATEAYRQYQQNHMPWAPTTREEALEFEASKHPVPPPTWTDPEYVKGYKDAHPQRPYTDPMAVERLRQQGQREHDARVAKLRKELATVRPGTPATPQQQNQAEHLAAQQLLRIDPQFAPFYDLGAKRFKGLGEVVAGLKPTEASLARDYYQKFLSKLDEKKKEILGGKAPRANDDWDVSQILDQDEEEN